MRRFKRFNKRSALASFNILKNPKKHNKKNQKKPKNFNKQLVNK